MTRRPGSRRTAAFDAQDLVVEAVHSLGASPGRLVITSLGTVVGIASLVLTLGFAQTASGEIARQFDAELSTHVTVSPAHAGDGSSAGELPADADERVLGLRGVVAAGIDAVVRTDVDEITALAVDDPSRATTTPPTLVAASPGLFAAVEARVARGRVFDTGHDSRADRVVVLGSRAAERLGVARIDNRPSVLIGDRPYAVLGIIDRAESRPDLLDAAIVPMASGRRDFAVPVADQVQILVQPGAAELVSRQSPLAILPNDPGSLSAVTTEAPTAARAGVEGELNVVFVLLGALALLVGVLGIATVTQLSVTERTGEIGLRRALGARRRDISRQFTVEALIVGVLGGLVGAALGILVLVVTSLIRGWVPVVHPLLPIGAVVIAAAAGLVAGVVPARNAARIEPARALSGGAG